MDVGGMLGGRGRGLVLRCLGLGAQIIELAVYRTLRTSQQGRGYCSRLQLKNEFAELNNGPLEILASIFKALDLAGLIT